MLRWFEANKLLTADELSTLDADNFVQWFVDTNEQVSKLCERGSHFGGQGEQCRLCGIL